MDADILWEFGYGYMSDVKIIAKRCAKFPEMSLSVIELSDDEKRVAAREVLDDKSHDEYSPLNNRYVNDSIRDPVSSQHTLYRIELWGPKYLKAVKAATARKIAISKAMKFVIDSALKSNGQLLDTDIRRLESQIRRFKWTAIDY